ncbi:hypothetical protein GOB36_33480, partial [Sinorhizobium meliloti]|nr:hypothetical protein [Sinorhizobium meliloti]MDX0036419.1 hypothetical protein [Sinorhizobium meliloti]
MSHIGHLCIVLLYYTFFDRAYSLELPPKDRTCSGLRLRADELARRLIS